MAHEYTAGQFRQKVRNGDVASVKLMLKAGVDYKECGLTQRKWTPLHTACWGTAKPQYDREIVEAILMQAQKDGAEEQLRGAKDALDGKTPADLAKERRDTLMGGSAEDKEQLDEKRKFDKIIEMVEKGVQS